MRPFLLAASLVVVTISCKSEDPPRVVEAPPVASTKPVEPAFGLTSSDGEGLRFVELSVTGLVQRPLAFTELRMTFENPADRVREGRFRITLPPGGSVARFAMKIGEQWQEGEMIEKRFAQRVYDDFLHRRQDPALLEQESPNEFSAKVFPIPAHGRKELILSYTHELHGDEAYTVPLRGLPGLARYAARVVVREGGGDRTVEASQASWVPDRDLSIAPIGKNPDAVRNGGLVVARVKVPGDLAPEKIESLAILVDTSASRAAGFAREAALVQDLAAALPRGTSLLVAAYDQEVAELFVGEAQDFKANVITSRRALGATDPGLALAWLKDRVAKQKFERVLLVGDGVATAGLEGEALTAAAKALASAGVQRLDALSIGGIRDDAALARLARGGFAREGLVVSSELPVPEILRRLRTAARSGLKVEVSGSTWVQPSVLDNVQPGDEVLVRADAPERGPIEVLVNGQVMLRTEPVAADRALVERACAAGKVATLVDRQASIPASDTVALDRVRDEIVRLSTSQRVSSPLTAFLVLETDQDYQRYGIDRGSAGAIWTVGAKGLEAVKRGSLAQLKGPSVNDLRLDEGRNKGGEKDKAAKEEGFQNGFEFQPPREAAADDEAAQPPPPPSAPAPASMGMDGFDEAKADVAPAGLMALQAAPRAEPARGGSGRSSGHGIGSLGDDQGELAGLGQRIADRREALLRVPPTGLSGDVEVKDPKPSGAPDRLSLVVLDVDGPLKRDRLATALGKVRRSITECFTAHDWAKAPPSSTPTFEVRLSIAASGKIDRAGFTPADPAALIDCLTGKLAGQVVTDASQESASARLRLDYSGGEWVDWRPAGGQGATDPWTGKLADVMKLVKAGSASAALEKAVAWREEEPGDVLALVALGEAAEASGDHVRAARAFGSIIDLFPSRADLRRFAGNQLERIGTTPAFELAADSYRHAVEQRPDHPSSHHLLGLALLRAGRPAQAFEAFAAAVAREYPDFRFAGAPRILAEDLGLAAAAWKKAEPKRAKEITARLAKLEGTPETGPSVRFVLTWETDGNDVDFHIHDRHGSHAFYSSMHLPSGGDLYADVTTGYGPECFTVRGPAAKRAAPYWLDAHYYSRGPMGYGMGKVEVITHDGSGGFTFETRPFVIMQDQAFVDMGRWDSPAK